MVVAYTRSFNDAYEVQSGEARMVDILVDLISSYFTPHASAITKDRYILVACLWMGCEEFLPFIAEINLREMLTGSKKTKPIRINPYLSPATVPFSSVQPPHLCRGYLVCIKRQEYVPETKPFVYGFCLDIQHPLITNIKWFPLDSRSAVQGHGCVDVNEVDHLRGCQTVFEELLMNPFHLYNEPSYKVSAEKAIPSNNNCLKRVLKMLKETFSPAKVNKKTSWGCVGPGTQLKTTFDDEEIINASAEDGLRRSAQNRTEKEVSIRQDGKISGTLRTRREKVLVGLHLLFRRLKVRLRNP